MYISEINYNKFCAHVMPHTGHGQGCRPSIPVNIIIICNIFSNTFTIYIIQGSSL